MTVACGIQPVARTPVTMLIGVTVVTVWLRVTAEDYSRA
jgi:hypothetical protein